MTTQNEPLEARLLSESGEFIRKELDKHGNYELAVQDLVLYTIAETLKAAVSANKNTICKECQKKI